MKKFLAAVKETLLCFSPQRSLYEAMMKYDFKMEERRQSLMQLCFSPLAAWPLALVLLFIYLDPTKHLWSLQKILGDQSQVLLFLLDGQITTMLIFFSLFFLIEWILRKEFLLTAFVFYFLAKSDLHIHLATAAVLGVYFSKACHLWWFHIDLESETKKIWQTVTNLLLLSWLVVSIVSIYLLDYLQANRFFAGSVVENRYEFLALVIFSLYAVSLILLSAWGHFYIRRRQEPSYLPVYYSTEKWILRFKMSAYLKKLLKQKIAVVLPEHQQSAAKFKEIKDQSPGLGFSHLLITLNKEISYLEQATSRLTID